MARPPFPVRRRERHAQQAHDKKPEFVAGGQTLPDGNEGRRHQASAISDSSQRARVTNPKSISRPLAVAPAASRLPRRHRRPTQPTPRSVDVGVAPSQSDDARLPWGLPSDRRPRSARWTGPMTTATCCTPLSSGTVDRLSAMPCHAAGFCERGRRADQPAPNHPSHRLIEPSLHSQATQIGTVCTAA